MGKNFDFDRYVFLGATEISGEKYVDKRNEFATNPNKCFLTAFLDNRLIAAKELVKKYSKFDRLLGIINSDQVLETRIDAERDAISELDQEYKDEKVFILRVAYYAVGLPLLDHDNERVKELIWSIKDICIPTVYDYDIPVGGWEELMVAAMLWFADKDDYQKKVVDKYSELRADPSSYENDESKIDLTMYSGIAAKLYGQYCKKDDDARLSPIDIRYLIMMADSKAQVAQSIAADYPEFEPAYIYINENKNKYDIGAEFDEVIKYGKSLSYETVDYAVLLASLTAFMDKGNPDRETTNRIFGVVETTLKKPGECIIGLSNIALFVAALWFSDYKGFKELVFEQIKKHTEDNWYNADQLIDLEEVRNSVDKSNAILYSGDVSNNEKQSTASESFDVERFVIVGKRLIDQEEYTNVDDCLGSAFLKNRLIAAQDIAGSYHRFEELVNVINKHRDDDIDLDSEISTLIKLSNEYEDETGRIRTDDMAILMIAYRAFSHMMCSSKDVIVDEDTLKITDAAIDKICSSCVIPNNGWQEIMVAVMLWYSDKYGYRDRVAPEWNSLKKAVERARNNIPDYDNKSQLVKDVSKRVVEDPDSLSNNPELGRKFVQAFMEIEKYYPFSVDERMRFVIYCDVVQPELVYKNTGLVSADYFISQFDRFVKNDPDNAPEMITAFLQDITYKAMTEWNQAVQKGEDLKLEDCNWTIIGHHFDKVAVKLGIKDEITLVSKKEECHSSEVDSKAPTRISSVSSDSDNDTSEQMSSESSVEKQAIGSLALSVTGIIMSFVLLPIGILCSLLGIVLANEVKKKGNGSQMQKKAFWFSLLSIVIVVIMIIIKVA